MKNDNTQNNNAMRLGAAALAVIATTAIVAGGVYAFDGGLRQRGFNPEKRAAIKQSLYNNDFNAWKDAVGPSPIAEKINSAESFAKLAEAHHLMRAGKFGEAKVIREELGLGCRGGFRRGVGPEAMAAARTAIEKNDYNAWKEAVGDNPIGGKIAADNFPKLAEAHKLMRAGKYEEAKVIRDELGLGGRGMMGGMMKGGMCGW